MMISALVAASAFALQPPRDAGSSGTTVPPPDPARAASPLANATLNARTLEVLAGFPSVAPNVWRVAGPEDLLTQAVRRGVQTVYRFGDRMRIDTKLPVGYPQPTPPEVVEIKAYPAVRRAEIDGRGNADLGMNLAFWPLFRHIDRNDIAMTAPVEMDYRGDSEGTLSEELDLQNARNWTMSFLYEVEGDGPTGDYGRVEVVDREATLVVAIGLRGGYRYARTREATERLREWLASNPAWEMAGEPRTLFYNGPERRPADQWAELQVPIRLAATEDGADRADTSVASRRKLASQR
ncbi:MAG: heme-binding protein [Phycisphaerales bacterium]|nr:heme-binding protein [Phycisphaerales bacterium]